MGEQKRFPHIFFISQLLLVVLIFYISVDSVFAQPQPGFVACQYRATSDIISIVRRLGIRYEQTGNWITIYNKSDCERVRKELSRDSPTTSEPVTPGTSTPGSIEPDTDEEVWRKAFERERDKTYGTLKGVKADQLEIKGPESSSVVGVGTAWRQLSCANYIARKAAEAALRGDFKEAGFLSDQSAQAMEGATLKVSCPEIARSSGLQPPSPKTVDAQNKLYRTLLKLTEEQTKKLKNAERRIKEVSVKKGEAEKAVSERERELKELKLKPVDSSKPQEAERKKEEIEKATSFLEIAKKELSKAEADLAEVIGEKEKIRQTLESFNAIFDDVEKNPDGSSIYLERLEK